MRIGTQFLMDHRYIPMVIAEFGGNHNFVVTVSIGPRVDTLGKPRSHHWPVPWFLMGQERMLLAGA